MMKNGITGMEYQVIAEKEALAGIAKMKVRSYNAYTINNKVGDVLNKRGITVPSMLNVYCNMMELQRLRNEIILAASETAVLGEIYTE
jgi:hypothetical protein